MKYTNEEIERRYNECLKKFKYDDNKIDFNAQTKMDRLHNIFLKMLEEKVIIENNKINKDIKQQIQRSKREKKYKAQYAESITTITYNNVDRWISEEHVKALAKKYKVTIT